MKSRKYSFIPLLILLLLSFAPDSLATQQIRDRLQDGLWTQYVLGTEIPQEILERKPNSLFLGISSSCWRGFVAEWAIQDGALLLVSAKAFDGSPLSTGLDKTLANGPIHASWFSGQLYSPKLCVLCMPSDLVGGVYFGSRIYSFKNGRLIARTFKIEPVGAAILLIELMVLGLVIWWIMKRRRRKALNQMAGAGR